MGTVLLVALGVLVFVTGPALALVIVLAVRSSARVVIASRRAEVHDARRIPVRTGHR